MRTISFPALAGISIIAIFALVPYSAGAADTIVNITDTGFIGKTIDIASGNTVTWVNAGLKLHNVKADNGSFGSPTLASGQTHSQVFTQPGTYAYYDSLNGGAPGGIGMSGVIRVSQQSPVPTQTPTPTTSGTNVTAQTQALYAQVIQLQQLLSALQQNATTGTVTPSVSGSYPGGTYNGACPRIGRVLKPGMSGDDVTRLQQYLAADVSVYPEASISGYYGVLTQAAVQRWQIKNNIVSTGTPDTTGFGVVGPRTAAAMAVQCSPNGTTPSTGTAPAVGGFIQVTPVSGNAPLTVSVQANVNTVNSCQSATYVLDWGDGTNTQAIPVSANACTTVQQTYSHTYSYGGQYLVKLSAGGHESTATVVVNGPARPTTGGTTAGALVLTAPIGGQNFAPNQTISIAWQTNTSLPAGSTIVFDLYTGAGQKVATNDVIAISSFPSGSIGWTIPIPGTVCPAIYPGRLCGVTIPTGSYKIVAKAYQPSVTGNVTGAPLAEAASGVFTIIASNVTLVDTFVASVTSGQPPLNVTFAGKVSSSNSAWCQGGCFNLLQFGDGGAEFIALPTAQGTSMGYTVSHTYQNTGVYTARLFQSQDTSGPLVGSPITITVGNAGTNFTYGPLEVGPGDSSNGLSLSFSATFDLPSACTGYKLTWGDGSSEVVQAHASTCTQAPVVRTLDHTYSTGGSYTVSLSRGASLDRKDSVGISVTSN